MINSEKAFDMLPFVSDIYEKIDMGKYIANKKFELVKNKDKNKSKNKEEVDEVKIMGYGLDMFSYIMKNSPKVKDEFFNIVAIIEDKELKEVKAQPLGNTLKTIKLLFKDVETMIFFKQAMQ